MPILYRIKAWGEVFENNETKKLKHLHWTPVPVHRDKRAYRRLAASPGGAAAYGIFIALRGVAACCNPRGTLCQSDGSALDVIDLAAATGFSLAEVDSALKLLTSKGIKWLEAVESPDPSGALVPEEGENRTGEKRTGDHRVGEDPPIAPPGGAGDGQDPGSGVGSGSGKAAGEKRGTRIPEDYALTEDLRRVAREEEIPDSEVERLFRGFVGYWRTVPGAKGRKLDWRQTWRNRCIDQAPRLRLFGRAGTAPKPGAADFSGGGGYGSDDDA